MEVFVLLCVLGVLTPFATSQICPEGQVCPATYPVRSDPGSETCDTAEAATIRSEIQMGVAQVIESEVKPRLDRILQDRYQGLSSRFPAESCAAIREAHPGVSSGNYWLADSNGNPQSVYCDLSEDLASVCSNGTVGWIRVASYNVSDPDQGCPDGEFVLLENPRRCERTDPGVYGCNAGSFSVKGIDYDKVCGKVIGYQEGTGDAFQRGVEFGRDINDVYVDGVSLTYSSPRQHIWSFASYTSEFFTVCPCSTGTGETTPLFVGNDYFCESGANTNDVDNEIFNVLFEDDPIWDGMGCREVEVPCCSGSPWFYKSLPATTNADIEIRLCADDNSGDEMVNFFLVEIYVQ